MIYRIKMKIGYRELIFDFDYINEAATWVSTTMEKFVPRTGTDGDTEEISFVMEFKEGKDE